MVPKNKQYQGLFPNGQEGLQPLNFAPMVDFLFLMLTTTTLLLVLQPSTPKALEASLSTESAKKSQNSTQTKGLLFDVFPNGFCHYKLPSGKNVELSPSEIALFIQKNLSHSSETVFLRIAEQTSWTVLSETMLALQGSGHKVQLLLKNNLSTKEKEQ